MTRTRALIMTLLVVWAVGPALARVVANTTALDKAVIDLQHGKGAAAEEDIWTARQAGVNPALTHHLMAQAYLLEGDAIRALREANPAQISPQFAAAAAAVRIKADLMRGDLGAAGPELDAALVRTPNDDAIWADLARFRSRQGDLAGAMVAAHHAVSLNARSIDALLLTASLERDQNGLLAAIPWFKRVLSVDPKNIAALLELAATQGDAGQASAMLATTRRILLIEPNNPRAFYLQAVLAARANHLDLARALLYRTSPVLDDLPGAILLRGLVEFEAGDNEQALAQFSRLAEIQPYNLHAQRLLGAIYTRMGNDAATIDTLQPLADRPDADSYTLLTLARALENSDQRGEAVKYLDRAAQPVRGASTAFNPDESISLLARNDTDNPNNAESAVPFMQGLILSGDTADAIGKAQVLARLNPGVPLASVLVGDAQMAAAHYADAVMAYRRAAAISFTEPTMLRLVNALEHEGDIRAAADTLSNYLAQNPRNVSALWLTASLAVEQGQWAHATTILEGLRTRLGNSDSHLLNTLAWCWLNQGDTDRALVYARAAYTLQPANPAIANTYGWLLFQTSINHGQGLNLLEKAAATTPLNPALRLQLGEAYAVLGRRDDARQVLAPIAVDPNVAGHQRAAELITHL